MQQTLCFCNWRKFGSQISDNMDRWKADLGRVREEKRTKEKTRRREKISEEKESEERRSRCAKRWKGAFPMICGPGGSKSRLAKAAGAEPSGQMRDEKLHAAVARSKFASEKVEGTSRWERFWKLSPHAVVARSTFRNQKRKNWRVWSTFGSWDVEKVHAVAHLEVNMYKTHHVQSTFGSSAVQNMYAVVVRSTFRSQHVQNISLGALLEVEMLKKCMMLWREANFEVKSGKNWRVRTTFGRSDFVARGRRKGLCTLSKVRKTWGFCGSFNYNHHYTTLHYTTTTTTWRYTTLHYTTLQRQRQLHYCYTTLHYTIYITLRYATLTTLHYTTLSALHYATLRYTTLRSTTLITLRYNYNYSYNYTALRCAALH